MYRGIHIETGQVVALKYNIPKKDDSEVRYQSILKEANIMSRCKHTNFVQLVLIYCFILIYCLSISNEIIYFT